MEARRRRINSVKERGSHGALRSHLSRRSFSEGGTINCFNEEETYVGNVRLALYERRIKREAKLAMS